jgi:hypothetical protein
VNFELPENFIRLYDELLRSVSGELKPDREYCAFPPRCGGDYSSGLMFYGRATNGWIEESVFALADLKTGEASRRCAERIVVNAQKPICTPDGDADTLGRYQMLEDEKCDGDPMHWLKHRRKYITERRSQYWQCAKKIAERYLGVSDASWYRHVAWSNLYKVGPQQRASSTQPSGNPSTRLRRAQRPGCANILQEEINHFRPRCVVFLTEENAETGYSDEFPEYLTLNDNRPNGDCKYVRATAKLRTSGHECNVVLAEHPQGRSPLAVAQDVLMAMATF